MKITDGKKTVKVEIREWNGSGYNPDWSHDYFGAGSLPYDEENDCYIVDDVDYCIDFASDKNSPESAVFGNDSMEVIVTEI